MSTSIRYGTDAGKDAKDFYFKNIEELPNAVSFGPGTAVVNGVQLVSNGAIWSSVPLILGNSGVKVSLTGTTDQTLMGQVALPDGCMGPNSTLRVEPKWTHENDANNKTMTIGIGTDVGDALLVANKWYNVTRGTGFAGATPLLEVVNRGVQNSQLRKYSDLGNYSSGSSSTAEQTTTMDLSRTGLSLYFFGQLASASNTLSLQGYTVTLINGYA